MDLMTYWCVQVACKHKVPFQQQLLSAPPVCVYTHTVHSDAVLSVLREGAFTGPAQVSNLRASQRSADFCLSLLTA